MIHKLFHNNIFVVKTVGVLMRLTKSILILISLLDNFNAPHFRRLTISSVAIMEMATCSERILIELCKTSERTLKFRKIIQEAEELRKSEARARSQKIFIDDDDDNLGFYAVHPNTIHTPVSQNIEPKDSLIMGDGHINTTPETEAISVETLVSNPRVFRFWKLHGLTLWKDKAMPTISIDGPPIFLQNM
ncbi:hypothetical protein Tco_0290497 [Tanacetum coccineum]